MCRMWWRLVVRMAWCWCGTLNWARSRPQKGRGTFWQTRPTNSSLHIVATITRQETWGVNSTVPCFCAAAATNTSYCVHCGIDCMRIMREGDQLSCSSVTCLSSIIGARFCSEPFLLSSKFAHSYSDLPHKFVAASVKGKVSMGGCAIPFLY
jgi:hypothetical protein